MKIALVTFRFDTHGGAVSVVRSLAHGLRDQGHRVVVVTADPARGVTASEEDGLRVVRFRPVNLYWVGDKDRQPTWKRVLWQSLDLWNPWVHRTLRQVFADESPDLVHVHKLRGLSPAVWTAARSAGVPGLIQTCHDYEVVSPEGTLRGRVGAWARRRVPWIRPYQAPRRWLSRSVDVVTAPSRRPLDEIVELGFFAGARQTVIPNSHGDSRQELARRRSRAAPPPAGDRELKILFLGRLDAVKGIEGLCRAVATVSRRRSGVELSIAGSGPLEADLRRRFDTVAAIRFRGFVSGPQKERMLDECDLLAVPSLVPETFGIVVAEAYAHGKPVLASRIGALPELVQEGRTGFLVEPGDEDDLVRTLERLAGDAEQVRGLRDACFERAALYTSENVLEAYLDVYENRL